ncbi:MAG: CalY family protein [Bacilli bacterium]|nr:CalY family protein [Bacilli bacterium]
MKKTLLTAILMSIFSLAMLLGSTFAWFSETITVENNVIKTGKFDLEAQFKGTGATWYQLTSDQGVLFETDNAKPGDTAESHLKLTNKGTLDMKVYFEIIDEVAISDYMKANLLLHFTYKNQTFTLNYQQLQSYSNDFYFVLPGMNTSEVLSNATEQIKVVWELNPAMTVADGAGQTIMFTLKLKAIQADRTVADFN